MNPSKIALVTGASSGIGKTIAMGLIREGFVVYGTSRRVPAHAEDGIRWVALDVRSDDSVKRCVEEVIAEAGHIDVLVNNAGFLAIGAIEETNIEEAKGQLETNFFGVVRMNLAVLPHLRKQKRGTIIVTGSLAGLVGVPFEGFYSASKHALEGYCETLAMELSGSGISVSLLEPGFMKTGIESRILSPAVPLPYYDRARTAFFAELNRDIEKGTDPRRVADLVVKIVGLRNPAPRYRIGSDAKWVPRFKAMTPWSFYQKQILKKFTIPRRTDGRAGQA